MQRGNTIVKLLIAIVILVLIWKVGIPKLQELRGPGSTSSAASHNASCVTAAETASEVWGSGLRNFVNPPYDMAAWDEFRGRTGDAISAAERECRCNDDSCVTVKTAMSELRSLVAEMDSSIRSSGPPPAGIVQRQEQIDNAINAARDLVRQGR
jgi:hypothetical protein